MAADDKELLAAVRSNPEKGFRQLMAHYKEPVYWHIRRLVVTHADAQDATQETFVRVFRSLDTFRGDSSLSSWIYRIATNEAMRTLERRREEQSIDDPEALAHRMLADEYVDYSDLEAVKLQRAILSLPTKQQLVFNLRYYDELGYDEIATITGITADSAKSSYHIAKDKVIQFLKSND